MRKETVQTGSQNTIKAYEVLKANGGEMTYGEIAAELDLKTANILGGCTSLRKKGFLVDGAEKTIDGKTYKTIAINPDVEVEFEMKEAGAKGALSEKAVAVIKLFQAEGEGAEFTAAEVAEKLGWAQAIAVNGVVNGLVKRGLAQREAIIVEMPDATEKEVKVISLTEAGLAHKLD